MLVIENGDVLKVLKNDKFFKILEFEVCNIISKESWSLHLVEFDIGHGQLCASCWQHLEVMAQAAYQIVWVPKRLLVFCQLQFKTLLMVNGNFCGKLSY